MTSANAKYLHLPAQPFRQATEELARETSRPIRWLNAGSFIVFKRTEKNNRGTGVVVPKRNDCPLA